MATKQGLCDSPAVKNRNISHPVFGDPFKLRPIAKEQIIGFLAAYFNV